MKTDFGLIFVERFDERSSPFDRRYLFSLKSFYDNFKLFFPRTGTCCCNAQRLVLIHIGLSLHSDSRSIEDICHILKLHDSVQLSSRHFEARLFN